MRFKNCGKWSEIITWILALIPCVTCEESPKAKFHRSPEFLKFPGFFTEQLLAIIEESRKVFENSQNCSRNDKMRRILTPMLIHVQHRLSLI